MNKIVNIPGNTLKKYSGNSRYIFQVLFFRVLTFLLVLITTMAFIFDHTFYSKYKNKFPYVQISDLDTEVYKTLSDVTKPEMSLEEMRSYILDNFDQKVTRRLLILELDLDVGISGQAIMSFKTIIIYQKRAEKYKTEYIFTLVHELMHIKYNTANERLVEFRTFEYLWEDEETRYIAADYILKYRVFENLLNLYEDYNTIYYINEYLKGW